MAVRTTAAAAAAAPTAGWCKLKLVVTRVESAWLQRLKLQYDEPLSKFAFDFNLRALGFSD